MKKTIASAIILTGFIAMASQIVLVRELLVVFYGNELSISFILATWLMAGAVGSSLLGRLSDRIRTKVMVFSACQIVLAVLLPLNIALIRSIKPLLGVNPGETIPLFPVMASAFVILAPACMILGFMFALACRVYESTGSGAVRAGSVYVLEAVGAMAGGIIASFVLVRLFGSMQIMALLGLLAAGAAAALMRRRKEKGPRLFLITVAAAILMADILLCVCGLAGKIDRYLERRQWPGYEFVASKNSIYGNVAILKSGDQFSFFDNGLHLYTIPDPQSSEEAVHFALLEHPAPKSVLLIGGGAGGLIAEIVKHPVEKIDYIELDPLIIRMAEQYLPAQYRNSLSDKRVDMIFVDARYFIKTSARKYDVILMSLGDPHTAQLNRFYTAEFYGEALKAMNEGGVISSAITSSESYISKDLGEFLRSIYATLKTVFSDVKVMPGETAYFLASPSKGILTYDYNILMDRAKARGLDIKYVREYYLFSRLSPGNISYMENTMKKAFAHSGKINRDFYPISYYYDMVFWTTRFKGSLFSRVFRAVTGKMIWAAVLGGCAIISLWGLLGHGKKRPFGRAVLPAVMANGFSQMTFQIIILLSFQIIYGYLFYKLGLILTACMAGLALGGWYGTRMVPKMKTGEYAVMAVQGALFLYALALPLIFKSLAGFQSGISRWIGANAVFTFLPFFSGLLGGFLFPVANRIRLENEDRAGSVAGLTYGMDLAGSCLGALLTGAILIPIIGIPGTCIVAAVLNITVLAVLVVSRQPVVRGP